MCVCVEEKQSLVRCTAGSISHVSCPETDRKLASSQAVRQLYDMIANDKEDGYCISTNIAYKTVLEAQLNMRWCEYSYKEHTAIMTALTGKRISNI
jgi:hypothetical protein